MVDKIDFQPAVDFEPVNGNPNPVNGQQPATPILDTVQKTLELGGTVAGGMAGAAGGALTSVVDGPVGPVVGGIAGAGLGRALGTSASNLIRNFMNPAQTPQLSDQMKDVAGSAVQGAEDQATGEAVGAVAKPVISSLGDMINNGLAKLSQWKLGASVPAKAAEIAAKSKFDLPSPTDDDIKTGVANVQKALNDSKADAGAILNKAKSDIGIPTTVAEREASLQQYGNPHGLGPNVVNSETQAMLDSKSPEELAANIAKFKATATNPTDPAMTARVANALQDKVNDFVDWNKTGSTTEGVLKQQYKDLGDIITNNAVGLQPAKSDMANTLNVFNDLKNKLADQDSPGKAEQFLRGLFTKDTPQNQDYLNRLGQLEEMSGKPVLTDLFKNFAGESFDKLVGSPKAASVAGAEAVTSLIHGNLPGALLSTGYLGAQSPSLIKAAGQANVAATEAATNAVKSKLFTPSVIGLNSLKNEPSLQSLLDRMKKQYKD